MRIEEPLITRPTDDVRAVERPLSYGARSKAFEANGTVVL
jgi:hypothetical protein